MQTQQKEKESGVIFDLKIMEENPKNSDIAPEGDEFITTPEAMQILGVKQYTIYKYVKQGKLIPYRSGVGNGSMYLRSQVEELAKPKPKLTKK